MAPPVIPVVILGMGAYLTWFGVHYWDADLQMQDGTKDTKAWPTTPVKAVLTGKGLPIPVDQTPAQQVAQNVEGTAPVASPTAPAGNSAPGVAGGTYDRAALMKLWTLNGGSAGTANIAAAIALAESSGRSNVMSTQAGAAGGASCINVGLWQLATCGKGAGYSIAQLQNPDTNARVTVFSSANGTNWSAWETYANGSYKKFLG